MNNQLTFEEMYEKYIQYRKVCGRKDFTTYSVINRFYNRRKNYQQFVKNSTYGVTAKPRSQRVL